MIFKTISKVLLICGTILLIYWTNVFREEEVHLFRSELFYFFALIFGLCYFIHPNNIGKAISMRRGIYLALQGLVFSVLIATATSLSRYNVSFTRSGIVMLIKLVLCLSLFILTYTYLKEDKLFCKRLSLAFYLPPLILIPFLFFSELTYEWLTDVFIAGGEGRFYGFSSNPVNLAQSIVIALSFVYILFLYNYSNKRWLLSLLYLSFTVGLLGLLFWTQSRGFVITAIVIIIIENVLVAVYLNRNIFNIITMYIYNSLTVLLIIGTFLILPSDIKSLSYSRLSHLYAEDRVLLWSYYSELFMQNPLGLGLNYTEEFTIKRPELGDPLHPHNSVLDLGILGGVGLLFSIFYLLTKAFLNIKNKLRDKDNFLVIYSLGTGTALFGIWFGGMFEGAPLFYYGFWVLLAMALR